MAYITVDQRRFQKVYHRQNIPLKTFLHCTRESLYAHISSTYKLTTDLDAPGYILSIFSLEVVRVTDNAILVRKILDMNSNLALKQL